MFPRHRTSTDERCQLRFIASYSLSPFPLSDFCWFQVTEPTKLSNEIDDLAMAQHRRATRPVSQF